MFVLCRFSLCSEVLSRTEACALRRNLHLEVGGGTLGFSKLPFLKRSECFCEEFYSAPVTSGASEAAAVKTAF